MLSFLNDLKTTECPVAESLYLPSGLPASEIEDLLDKSANQPFPEELTGMVVNSKTGTALFLSNEKKYVVLPPFPVEENASFSGFNVEPLCLLLESDFSIGLILVHLGSYAIGICHGEKLISSKVGTGLVPGRHKKGGSSQQRFQRRRQNQAREFLDRVCGHIKEQFEPQREKLDYLVYGGPYQTVLQLKKRCSFLKSLSGQTLPSIDVPSLRQKVLETTAGRIWSSQLIELWEVQT